MVNTTIVEEIKRLLASLTKLTTKTNSTETEKGNKKRHSILAQTEKMGMGASGLGHLRLFIGPVSTTK